MTNICLYLTFFLLLLTTATISAQQPQCRDIQVLYPRENSLVDQSREQASTYLILGNTDPSANNRLVKVSLLHYDSEGTEVEQDVWQGRDELLKVSAIQQDLSKVKDLPNDFWFRVVVDKDGHQCQYQSGKFKIT